MPEPITIAETIADDQEPTRPMVDCFVAHRALVDRASVLSRRLERAATHESDLLRLGASCVRISSEQALAAPDERQAIRAWNECERGERQIRSATYHAFRKGRLDRPAYDETFGTASHAARARRGELLRLRRRLRQLAVI
jgi:hypothetical protein